MTVPRQVCQRDLTLGRERPHVPTADGAEAAAPYRWKAMAH